MNILCWNIRRVGGSPKAGVIRKIVVEKRAVFIGLTETKASNINDKNVWKFWVDDEYKWTTVNAINSSDGLLCVWASEFITNIETMVRERWVCLKGLVSIVNLRAAIILIYSLFNVADKHRMWEELLKLRSNLGVPMIVMGDFNEIRCLEERKGCLVLSSIMSKFDDWINRMGLIDMPLVGRKFTWRHGRSCSRLDRILIDLLWLEKGEFMGP